MRKLLLLALFIPVPVFSQILLSGYVSNKARYTLVSEWRIDREVGYCIEAYHKDSIFIVVDKVSQPFYGLAHSVKVYCGSFPLLHSHSGRICAPSTNDLNQEGEFGVIQCDVDGFVFFSTARPQYSAQNAFIYGGLAAGFLISNAFLQFDTDNGNYPNKWYVSKQGLHFTIASTLVFAASSAHVNPWIAAGITCGGGYMYEITQGFINKKDAIANCAGAFITSLWINAFKHSKKSF